MQFIKFHIKNFKGIKDTIIDLGDSGIARIYTLVGLNESGKTTLLEAIHSFSPDADTDIVVKNVASLAERRQQRVPKSRIADFTGRVSVKAELRLEPGDLSRIISICREKYALDLDGSAIAERFTIEKYDEYREGEYIETRNLYSVGSVLVKSRNQKTFRKASAEQFGLVASAIRELVPDIAYFPTFLFDFPDRIYLSPRREAGRINDFYRKLFQDILDMTGRNFTIDEHVVSRVRKDEFKLTWTLFGPAFVSSPEKAKITQVIDSAAVVVTDIVLRKWNEIFGEAMGRREVVINWNVDQGVAKKNDLGSEEEADEHDVYVQFEIKDGAERYPISNRSLGFRWFFSFLLFTQFRAARRDGRPIVFLFDEPASNLHAAAQEQLIRSFPNIARPPHILIYTTHSHYMVEPRWLEQSFIVRNAAGDAESSIIDAALSSDASIDVVATPYRQFVNGRPEKVSYFQPIMDRLEVKPSRFDANRGGIIVEGKSDYYLLRYLDEIYDKGKLQIIPAFGAGTMDALIGLMRGWGLPVRILLDSDKAGAAQKQRYSSDYFLGSHEIALLGELIPGIRKVENIFRNEDLKKMVDCRQGASKMSKKEILTLVQEHLAAGKSMDLAEGFAEHAKGIISKLREFQS